MNSIPSISDALRDVATETALALAADDNVNFGLIPKQLFFRQGNLLEITSVLSAMSTAPATKDSKYPFIALIRDVREKIGQDGSGLSTAVKARIGIFTITSPNFRADDREEKVFKPILLPIFNEFIKQLGRSKAFGMPTVKSMEIIKWDCYFYGTAINQKNQFNDYVDAIDIEQIMLTLKSKC